MDSMGNHRRWTWSKETFEKRKSELVWEKSKDGNWRIRRKVYEKNNLSRVPITNWHWKEVGGTNHANRELLKVFGKKTMPTPKPERLIQRILHLATNPGDLVLDAFAGSGTTGAVAHKMGRSWIMIEREEACIDLIKLRMDKVIEGEQGGISKAVSWKGGGSYIIKNPRSENRGQNTK